MLLLDRQDMPIRIATYNLRYDSQPDNITVKNSLDALTKSDPLIGPPRYLGKSGEQPWSTRRIKVAQQILSEGPDVIGFQEALIRQVHDLAELLGDDWGWIGVGRDDGANAGEFSPIFYKKSALTLVSQDTFWLSQTPFKPSKYPDTGCYRICSTAQFTLNSEDRGSPPRRFTLLNTHLDDRSDKQRRLGGALLIIRARYEAYKTSGPIFLIGDFNSPSTGNDSGAYQTVIKGFPHLDRVEVHPDFSERYAVPGGILSEFAMKDVRADTSPLRISGDFATYTGFNKPGDASAYTRIDFVFGGNNGGWNASAYKVASALTDDGVLSSDHRPVFADVSI